MERGFNLEAAVFTGLVDLAAEKHGGRALAASDDFFAGKENLLKPGRGVFIPDKYTPEGKWMDGWESRRKRVAGYDWCIIKLGLPGVVRGVDIDTNHFLGNHPPYASIEALCEDNHIADSELTKREWTEILSRVSLKQGSQNIFAVANQERWTHLRLNIYPDGGVARLKVYGEVKKLLRPEETIDLAALENGGLVVAANDMFFGNKNNMIAPGRGENMGDGWETRRRRDPGHDWAIVKLAERGMIEKIEVDTNFYKGNYPDTCWIEGCQADGKLLDGFNQAEFKWETVLQRAKMQADHRHHYEEDLVKRGPFSHLKISIAPDGGVSRLRVMGKLAR